MKKIYKVSSGDWESLVHVDDELFDTHEARCHEAMARSIEDWITLGDMSGGGLSANFCVAHDIKHKSRREDLVVPTVNVFENIGRVDYVRLLNDSSDERDSDYEDF